MADEESEKELVPVESSPLSPAIVVPPPNHNQGLLILFALLSSNMFALLIALVSEFLSLRGVVDVAASRIALIGAWVAGMFIVCCFVWGRGIRAKTGTVLSGALLMAGLLYGLDLWAPKPAVIVDPEYITFDTSLPRENFSLTVQNKTDFYAYSVQVKMRLSQTSSADFSFGIPSPRPIMEGSVLADIEGLRCADRNRQAVVMFWIYRMEPHSAREISITHNSNLRAIFNSKVTYFTTKQQPRTGDITKATGTFHFDELLTCNGDIAFELRPSTAAPPPTPLPSPKQFPYPGYISRLDLDAATIGETLDSPKYTAVELRQHNGSNNPITSIVNQGALVFHTEALPDSAIAAYQDQVLAEVMRAPLRTIAGLGPGTYGLIHIPNVPGSGSERLVKERPNILNAAMFLYVFAAYKYRDTEMPKDIVGVTEWCVRFNGPITVTTTPGRNISTLKKVDMQ